MVEYCKTIPDRGERTAMAGTIVEVMVDVDCPYEIVREEVENLHPHHISYTEGPIRYRHYGRALEEMVKAVAAMPESEERTVLTSQIAHAMKRQYLQWNRNTVDDGLIAEQLAELSDGRLTLPEGFTFMSSQELLNAMEAAAAKKEANEAKRKKRKKKK